MNIIIIIIGILCFLCFNFSYVLTTLHGLPGFLPIAAWSLSVILLLIFLGLSIGKAGDVETFLSKVRYIVLVLCSSLVGGWLILVSLIYLFPYQVLYTDSKIREKKYEIIQEHKEQFEEIRIKTSDNITLQGYLYQEQKNMKSPMVIYFGGRGEEATNIVDYASKLEEGWSLAFINYRGCGFSEGKQRVDLLYSDAKAIYDYFNRREDIDSKQIVLIAHSLGTGVAIHLSTEREVKGVVLSAPYDQYVSGVIQDKIPLIPLGLLIKEEYNSLKISPELKIPALFLLAENDRTIVRSRSMKLYHKWGGKTELAEIKKTNHETITFNEMTWDNINSFIKHLIQKPS